MRRLREVEISTTCQSPEHPGRSVVVHGLTKEIVYFENTSLLPGEYSKYCDICETWAHLIVTGDTIL